MPKLTCFGGASMVGGNQLILEDNGSKMLLDFGIPFKISEKYFEEFLQPRPNAGLEDYLTTGLIPPLFGLYREDLLKIHQSIRDGKDALCLHDKPEFSLILLSHAHVDHCSYLELLDHRIPVMCSQLTQSIMKVMQETQYSELISFTVKTEEGRKPRSKSEKIIFSRNFYDSCSDTVNPFSHQIRGFPVDHSIPGASSYIIRTSEGLVIYTGDFRAHGINKDSTYDFINQVEQLKNRGEKILALITEGTTLQREDKSKFPSEIDVYDTLINTFKSHPDELLVVDFGPRNIERLILTLQAAQQVGRKVLLLLKDAFLLKELSTVSPSIPDPSHPNLAIFNKRRADYPEGWEKTLLEEYSSKILSAYEVRKNPQDYIFLFSFWDVNQLIDLKIPDGVYIYSSSEAYSEEQNIDMRRLANWLKLFSMKFIGNPDSKEPNEIFHVSGHAYPPVLKEVVERIEPEILIPIHTEKPELFKELVPHQKILIPTYGETLILK